VLIKAKEKINKAGEDIDEPEIAIRRKINVPLKSFSFTFDN